MSAMVATHQPYAKRARDSELMRNSLAIRRLYDGFAAMLDTEFTLEETLPYYVGRLHYYQRLCAGALSRSVSATLLLGEQAAMSCRQWPAQLPGLDNVLPA